MPELPEVEVTRLGLLPYLPGRRVTKISHSGKRLRIAVPRKLLAMYVLGNTIISIDRRGKYLLFRMGNGSTLIIHLGMTGKLGLLASSKPPATHDHLRLLFDDGTELRFNDSRRFGSIMLWPPMEAEKMETAFSSRIGVEPFSREFNIIYLQKQCCTRKMPIKNFLMDSHIVAGVGNIYANEILFTASVHPQTPAKVISHQEWITIIATTRRILKKAIRAGGSTISDFLGSSGNPGYFQVHFNVYNRAGQKCKRCKNTITRTVIGGRATFFCPYCQPLKTDIP